MNARLLLLSIAAFVTVGVAPTTSRADDPESPIDGGWSVGVTGHVAPLEDYPRGGLSLDAAHRLRPRLRFGPRLTYYVPRSYGNVRRQVVVLDAALRVDALSGPRASWVFDLSLGLGVFHDDYVRVYDDVSRIAVGFSVGTALEVHTGTRLRPFVGVRLAAFFADDVVDDQWLEAVVGLRISVGR